MAHLTKILLKKRLRINEQIIQYLLTLCGFISVFITFGIIVVLFKDAWLFFSRGVSLREFFFGLVWQPAIDHFGILPLLNSTIMTSLIAMLVAVPVGMSVAIYLSEYATEKTRSILKPILEILAGIPTIVYGFFALTFLTPLLQLILGDDVIEVYNMFSAGLAMGILITPIIATMSEDALNSVPRGLRDAAYGVGATKLETSLNIVLPAAFSGIAASIIIGLSRAFGETMIVAMAAGSGPNLTFNPFKAAETMTGYMVRISGGDVGYDTMDYNSIFAIGFVLFLITMGLNILSRKIVTSFREEYD